MLITNLGSNAAFKNEEHEQISKYVKNIDKKWQFFSFYRFFLPNLTPVESRIDGAIEELSLYRMVYITISVNFNFASKKVSTFFLVCFVLSMAEVNSFMQNHFQKRFLVQFWLHYSNSYSVSKKKFVMLRNHKNTAKALYLWLKWLEK